MPTKKMCCFIGLLIACCIHVMADDKSDFRKALNISSGYYYSEAECKLVYMKLNDSMLDTQDFTLDFVNETLRKSGSSSTNIFYSDYYFLKAKSSYQIQNGKVTSFESFNGDVYIPLPVKTEKDIIAFMRGIAIKKFDRCLGNNMNSVTGRLYTIEKSGNNYQFTVKYPEKEDIGVSIDTLSLSSEYRLSGKKYKITFQANQLSIYDPVGNPTRIEQPVGPSADLYCVEDEEISGYEVTFTIEPLKNILPGKRTKTVDFARNEYYFCNGSQKRINLSESALTISTRSNQDYTYKIEKYSDQFCMYLDTFGWKHIEFGEDKFLVIDGKEQYALFNYHGESLKSDTTSVENQFIEVSNLPGVSEYPGGYLNINGGYFLNAKASSTLKDSNHEYTIEGTMNVFNPFELKRNWVINNLPWAEGKTDNGIGEFIEFDIIPKDWRAIEAINLRILSGYVDPFRPYLFKENNRLKKLLVETDSGYSVTVDFNDLVEFTSVELPKETKHVKLTIQDVYKGSKYSDTCITAFDMYYRLWER